MTPEGWDEREPLLGQHCYEYGQAIELVRSMRGASAMAPQRESVRYWSLPMGAISGDFHCAAEHPELGWYGLLADAVGHGLPAAILSLHAPDIFDEAVARGDSLECIYLALNRFLAEQALSHYFFCGLLVRVTSKEIEVLNAGMPDALLISRDGFLLRQFSSLNLPIGLADSGPVEAEHYRLMRGHQATLFLCSDGLTELQPHTGPSFSTENLVALLASYPDTALAQLTDAIGKRCSRIQDDISILEISLPFPETAAATAALAPERGVDAVSSVANWLPSLVVESLDLGVLVTTPQNKIVYINPAFTRITGYVESEAIGQTPRILRSGRHGPQFYKAMLQEVRDSGSWHGEIWNRRKDGSLYLEWLEIRALNRDNEQEPYHLGLMTDITQRRIAEKRTLHSTLHDRLTGLANRTLLFDRGIQEIHRAQRARTSFGIVLINLDRFKQVHGSLGHEAGDQLLREVAQRLAQLFREHDTLARSGNDEFVGIVSDVIEPSTIAAVARKILESLVQPFALTGHQLRVSASIGIALYPDDSSELDTLLTLADAAMRYAKEAGGNLYRFYAPAVASFADQSLYIEARLYQALGNGELELHYQPKMDFSSHRMVAVEALIRWRDPQRGLIPPAEFIPIAERSALIAEIGSFVLREACAMLARLHARGHNEIRMAINVSPLQFLRHDLVVEVREALMAFAVPASALQLEVTESLFIRDVDHSRNVLQRLAEVGVSLALDDFGSGYSSLGYLRQLPFDTLKVDQTFIRDVHLDRYNEAIVSAAINLAKGMDLRVVAEGVETCEECRCLQRLGCHLVQGYRYSRPMSETDFLKWLDGSPTACQLCQLLF